MFKLCGLFGNKKRTIESQLQEIILSTNEKEPINIMANSMVELKEAKSDLILEEDDNENDQLLMNIDDNTHDNSAINDDEQGKAIVEDNKEDEKQENDEEE